MFFLCPLLGVACLWDCTLRRIPNFLQFIIFGLGLILAYQRGGMMQVAWYVLEFVLMTALFYGFFKIGMIGGGDVKLFAVCSGFFEKDRILFFLLFAFAIAAVIGVIKLVLQGKLKSRMNHFRRYVTNTLIDFQINGKRSKPKIYMTDREEKIKNGVAMSGPVFISALMHLGGIY